MSFKIFPKHAFSTRTLLNITTQIRPKQNFEDEMAALIACVNAIKVLHLKESFSVVRQVHCTFIFFTHLTCLNIFMQKA